MANVVVTLATNGCITGQTITTLLFIAFPSLLPATASEYLCWGLVSGGTGAADLVAGDDE